LLKFAIIPGPQQRGTGGTPDGFDHKGPHGIATFAALDAGSNSGFDAGGTEREGWKSDAIKLRMKKKRSSQASWKHAAWELLSPDLRCFWKHHVDIWT